jgi:hypothetical protein
VTTSGNDRTVFIHVPKTGGGWVTDAMKAAGIQQDPIGAEHHLGKDQIDLRGRFAFAFVREPLSWYGSLWNFRRRLWREKESDPSMVIPQGEFSDETFARDFPDFVENVISTWPGYLSRYYEHYVGKAGDQVDFVGRYENLVDDLVRALEAGGEEFDEGILRNYPANNRSGPLPSCSDELKQRVLHAERGAYERFYGSS